MGKLQTKTLVLSFSCLSSALHLFVCSFSLSFVSNEGVEPRWQLHDYEFSLIHFVRILLLLTLFPNEDKDYLFFHENVKKKKKKERKRKWQSMPRSFVCEEDHVMNIFFIFHRWCLFFLSSIRIFWKFFLCFSSSSFCVSCFFLLTFFSFPFLTFFPSFGLTL